MNRFVYLLKKWTRRRICLAEYNINGHHMSIVDEHFLFGMFPDMRIMEGDTGWYSAIYKDTSRIDQPMYPEIQVVMQAWCNAHSAQNFLVLGCAGCSIPRFISKAFPYSHITGVELSQDMIKIAQQFFLEGLDTRDINLVHADAIEYVKHPIEKQEVCFVDLFDNCKIVDGIYDESFWENLSHMMTDTAMVCFNFYGQSLNQGEKLCVMAQKYFDISLLVPVDYGYFPILIKTNSIDNMKLSFLQQPLFCRQQYSSWHK